MVNPTTTTTTAVIPRSFDAEMGSDTEWKTQSLPSLGHVSSDNTLESSAEDYAAPAARNSSQKRNKKVVDIVCQVSKV